MQERLELIFHLFPLCPQVDHNIEECSPWEHNPGRNVSLSVLWSRLHTECTDLHEAYQYDTRESQTQLSTLTLHSFYSVFIHFPPQSVPSVTKPDKNRHKSRPFTSNSITEQSRPAIMSELPLLPCINPLRSHAISLDLCVTRDFLALEVQDIQRAKLETSITNYLHESK